MWVVIREYDRRADEQSAFEALRPPQRSRIGRFNEHPRCIDTELLREPSRHCLTIIGRRASAARDETLCDAARDRYAQVNALGDTLTLAERSAGRHETPC